MARFCITMFIIISLLGFGIANAAPTNGGFESNFTGWGGLVRATISSDAHSGTKACCLTGGTDVNDYGGASSSTFSVTGGQAYLLTSYVKQTAGTTRVNYYKVTLAWLRSDYSVIRYDNDWLGHNFPATYTFHGGVFIAPPSAAYCAVLLGVMPNTTCLFDDISVAVTTPPNDDSFLDNGLIRVGASHKWGGAIDYLAQSSNPSRNYINRQGAGRLLQRSYWGLPYCDDGPYLHFPWNPVQAGDGYENVSDVITLTNDGNTIYTKCQPMDYSGNNVRTNAIFETWVTLEGRAVRMEARFTNADEDHVLFSGQEQLALYVTTDLSTCKYYTGASPFTYGSLSMLRPDTNGRNEGYAPTEYWAAFVNDSNFGVGVFAQDVMNHHMMRAGTQGITDDYDNPTNYIGVIPFFTVPNKAVRTEVCYVMLDTLSNIRTFAYNKAQRISNVFWKFDEPNNRQGWFSSWFTDPNSLSVNDTVLRVNDSKWSFITNSGTPYITGPQFQITADSFGSITIRMSSTNSDTSAQILWSRITDAFLIFSGSKNFTIIPDGQMHTYTINVTGDTYWTGTITQLQFKPVLTGNGGTVSIDYIKIDGIKSAKNLNTGIKYSTIQAAINAASSGNTIEVADGNYVENIDFLGKNLILKSTDPNEPNTIANTIITGTGIGSVVTFNGGENSSCVITGLTIKGSDGSGILCSSSSPTISKCTIANNDGNGISLSSSSSKISNCLIIGNKKDGIEKQGSNIVEIINCTITENALYGIHYPSGAVSGDKIINSIIWNNNGPSQISSSPLVQYCDVQGGFTGLGNINADPCFAAPGEQIGYYQKSINLGTTNVENGLKLITTVGDGDTEAVTIGSANCRRTINAASDFYMYFNINDSVVYQGSQKDWYIEIIYYDTEGGSIGLQYDSNDGNAYKSGGTVTIGNTSTWKNYIFHVTDAYFGNRQNGGADFRIVKFGGGRLYLDWVYIRNYTSQPFTDYLLLLGDSYQLKSTSGRWNWDMEQNSGWVNDSSTSPCIDAGNPGCSIGEEPVSSSNVRINMGNYGGTKRASKTPANWMLLSDMTNDGKVDLKDIDAFCDYWLDSGTALAGDLNRNGEVNFVDFAKMADQWYLNASWY